METWPNFHIKRVETFEKAEQGLFRKILAAHSKTPIESLYLELGIAPFRFHLMARRIMYYQTVMLRDDDEITKKVVCCQKERQLSGDFYPQVVQDMLYLNIADTDVMTDSKHVLKEKIKKAVNKVAHEYLLEIGRTHSKVRTNLYPNIDGMKYMKDPRFTPDIVNLLFKFRTRMFNVRNNFRNNYRQTDILCPLCKKEEDSQEHLFKCETIALSLDNVTINVVYEDIFSDDTDKLLSAALHIKQLTQIRIDLEDEAMNCE